MITRESEGSVPLRTREAADGNGKWNGRGGSCSTERFPIFTEFTAACHKGAQFPSEQKKLEAQVRCMACHEWKGEFSDKAQTCFWNRNLS